jgi:hypothetical protein
VIEFPHALDAPAFALDEGRQFSEPAGSAQAGTE